MYRLAAFGNRLVGLVLFCMVAVILILSSCSDESSFDWQVTDPDENTKKLAIMVVAGNYQEASVEQTLPDSLVVFVSDQNLIPEPSWRVNFTVIFGEGTVSPASTITDLKGFAATSLTLGALTGEVKVLATPYMADSSVVFTATANN